MAGALAWRGSVDWGSQAFNEARGRMPTSPGLRIGRILGIPIYVHASWMIIFVLITMSLAVQFTQEHPRWTSVQHWSVGVATSLLFFASVLFHELSHSMVARIYKIRVISITLFVFGGVARIGREPAKAIQEFNIAIAGPLASLFLAFGFYSLTLFFPYAEMTGALAVWLWQTNAALALFNLLPGFPLDGGRIFRAIVWGFTKDYSRSTRVAARSGQVVAYGMIALGAVWAVTGYKNGGDMISGMWLAFIGWFLLTTARQSRAQADARGALEGLRVSDIMTAELPTVGREISLEDYAREILRTGRRAHLVVAHEQLVGLMTAEALHSVPQHDWEVTSVQAVMLPKEKLHWAAPEEPALSLLDRMRTVGMQQMPVIAGGSVVGIVTRDSILHVLQARGEIGSLAGR